METTNTTSLAGFISECVASNEPELHRRVVHAVERELLKAVLERFHGNQTRSAQFLGMSRFTLRTKLQSFGYWPIRLVPVIEQIS